jgi:hypothetical protein
VEKDSETIAYWIVEAAAQPQTRDALRDSFRRLAVVVHWVFLAQMLHEDEEMPNWVHLTTTEREFMRHTVYDDIVSQGVPGGQSLHYLGAETRTLTTFRGLHLVHAPHVFAGHKEQHALSTMQVSPKTGDFVHPGEYGRLQRYHQEQAHFANRHREAEAARARGHAPCVTSGSSRRGASRESWWRPHRGTWKRSVRGSAKVRGHPGCGEGAATYHFRYMALAPGHRYASGNAFGIQPNPTLKPTRQQRAFHERW